MTARPVAIAAALLSVLAVSPARAEWLEAKSKHFTVTGDVSESVMRRRLERLERFDAVMRLMIPRSTEISLPVLLVPNAAKVQELARGKDGLLGFFAPSPYGVFAVTPARVGSQYGISEESVLFHEYVHHMLMSSLDDPMPRWMNEGMAELFMSSRLEDNGSVMIGIGNSARAYSLVRLGHWTAQRLFESDAKPPSRMEVDQLYAKGWLMLHYLIFSGERAGQFTAFNAALKRGVPQLDAARQAFGDLDKLESDLEYYRQRKELPAVRIAADKLGASTSVTIRPLVAAEADIMPLRWRSMAGVTADDAGTVAARGREVGARHAGNAFVQRAVAEMEFDARNYDAADQAIERALAADAGYVDALSFKGMLIGARAKRENRPELWQQARSWIVKANHAQPDNPFALMLYFDSFSAAGEKSTAAATNGLMRAIVLQPAYQDLRVKVTMQLIAANDIKVARAVLAPVAMLPHLPADNPYAKLADEIDKGTRGEALDAKIAEFKIDAGNLFVQPDPSKPKDEAGK